MCPETLPYIDGLTNPDYPTCVNSCGANHIYKYRIKVGDEEELNVYECVKSCNELNQYIYIDLEDSSKTKCRSLCPNGLYVDYGSTDNYFKNPTCVSECSDGYYVDKLTSNDTIFCVPSCK